MSERPKISRRAQTLLDRMRTQRLCCQADKTEEGIRRGGLRFWLQPSGRGVGPSTAQEVIKTPFVVPLRDGLFDNTSQTYALAGE